MVDLGTEFGVNVDTGGKTRVMVFEGEVEASMLDASGSAQRNRLVREQRALEIDPEKRQIQVTDARAECFTRLPELIIPPLSLAPSYRDAVLASRPWGYWRFEAMAEDAVANEIDGGPPLRANGRLRLVDAGDKKHDRDRERNRSIAFEADADAPYLLMDGLWAPPRDPGYAVELWFATERIGIAAVASLIAPGHVRVKDYAHVFLLELKTRNRNSIPFQRESIRFLHRWPPGLAGGDNLFSDNYQPCRWHHVVAQTNGDQMELYVDGTPLPPLSITADHATVPCELLIGRLKPLPPPPGHPDVRPFVGQVDELAVYEHPLTAAEIRSHYQMGGKWMAPDTH